MGKRRSVSMRWLNWEVVKAATSCAATSCAAWRELLAAADNEHKAGRSRVKINEREKELTI